MTNLKIYFFIFLLSPLVKAYDPKEGNIAAILGPFVSRTDYQGSDTGAKAPYFGDIGLIALGDVNERGALEIGLFHLHKIYFREQNAKTMAEKVELIHITMGYRRWLTPYFSASMAFSSSYPMGRPQIIHSDFAPGSEIDTSARDTVDYGFDFSLQGELWSKNRYAVVADARYGLSVTNKQDEKGNHYGLMLGLKYLIQEKYPTITK